jgi:hypothetical protein
MGRSAEPVGVDRRPPAPITITSFALTLIVGVIKLTIILSAHKISVIRLLLHPKCTETRVRPYAISKISGGESPDPLLGEGRAKMHRKGMGGWRKGRGLGEEEGENKMTDDPQPICQNYRSATVCGYKRVD